MKKIISSIIFSLGIAFSQVNYYVSTIGNDINNGSFGTPWLTIQFGLSQLATNDTLNILTGTYNEKISIPISNIYVRNYLSNAPIIDATGIISQNPIIDITNKSNITIDGLELKNNIQNDAQGILIEGSGTNITIKNCVIHDIHFSSNPADPVNASTNAQGIIVYGSTTISNLKILNNQLYDCRLGYSEGIAVNGNVDGFEVFGNSLYNLTNIGIDIIGHEGTCSNPANDQARNGLVKNNLVHDCISPYATSGGIYVDGGKSTIIENNTSYHNGYGIEVGCENVGKSTDSITIRNNIFYDNEVSALALGGFSYPGGSGKVMNSTFRNNTCYYNDSSNSGTGELYLSYCENCMIENNIFFTSAQNMLVYADLSQPGLIFNYNTFYCQSGAASLSADWNGTAFTNYTSFASGTSTNANSVFADPIFVFANITNPDFHLTTLSPSINAGDPLFVPGPGEVDMDGEGRTNGIVDCGADEFNGPIGIENFEKMDLYFYPNPTTGIIKINVGTNSFTGCIEVINITGEIILQNEINLANENQIDLINQPKGIYFLKLNDGKKAYIQKILVQ